MNPKRWRAALRANRFARGAVRGARLVLLLGRRRKCPCCGWQFRHFAPAGAPPRPEARCPRCGSLERHRLLALYLPRSRLRGRVLHFAPESMLRRTLQNLATSYLTTDIQKGVADISADIVHLPFTDGQWDVIVCSHVLEHVPDDAAAMAELRRVLAPDGTAVIVVPRLSGAATDEDPAVTDPEERIRRFGQHDHVRIYGEDLEDRLRSAGFKQVQTIKVSEFPDADRYVLRNTIAGPADALVRCS